MRLDRDNIGDAIRLKENLGYLIDLFKNDKLGYVKTGDLEKALEEVEKDIEEYQKQIENQYSVLKSGTIIKIFGGDGISYSKKDYCKISQVTEDKVYFDMITVVHGDYGNEIRMEKEVELQKEVWIEKYERNYHEDNIPEDEWNELVEYTEKIPRLKDN